MTPIPLRLNRWSGCRCCLQHEQVGGFGGAGCGGEEGGARYVAAIVARRANSGAGGGGPWSVSASVLVLPAEDLRSRQLHISTAELAGCCRLVREPPVVSAIPASVTCGSSKRDGLRPAALWPVRQESIKGVGVEGQDPETHPPAGLKSLRHSVPAMTHESR